MRKDYPIGTKVLALFSGAPGTIVAVEHFSYHTQYEVEMEGPGQTTERWGYRDIAPADHPLHELISDWNRLGHSLGAKGMYIGERDGEWVCVFGEPMRLNHMSEEHPDIEFRYSWRMRDLPF